MQKSPSIRPLRRFGFPHFKIFFQESKHDTVRPLAVPEIRLPFNSFTHKAHALRVANGTVVEPVALQLEAVEAEVVQEVALKLARSLVGDALPAKVRVGGEAAEVRDPAAPVRDVERHRACALPPSAVRHVDHEPPGLERLLLGT